MSLTSRRSSFSSLFIKSKNGDMGKKANKAQPVRAPQPPPKLPEFSRNSSLLSTSFSPNLPGGNTMNTMNGPPPQYEANGRHPLDTVSALIKAQHAIPDRETNSNDKKESMTNRGRYSYSNMSLNSNGGPRRVRRRRDPTSYNVLIVGTQNAGKTSFVEFLKTALAPPAKTAFTRAEEETPRAPPPPSGNFIPHYLETEIDGERVGLTLWDSEGFERNIVDLQIREMSAFLESKFEETFAEEMKVVRSPGVQDTHIHVTFLILDPFRLDRNIAAAKRSTANGFQNGSFGPRVHGVFDEDLEVQILRALNHTTTVIPIISKADTITAKHMKVLKKNVWDSLKALNLDPLEGLGLDEDSDYIDEDEAEYGVKGQNHAVVNGSAFPQTYPSQGAAISPPATPSRKERLSGSSFRMRKTQNELKEENREEEEMPFFPLSIISPDPYEPDVVGRKFVWGFADPYDEEHCDFQRLHEAIFREWRNDLRSTSRELWYEGWRTNRLKSRDLLSKRR